MDIHMAIHVVIRWPFLWRIPAIEVTSYSFIYSYEYFDGYAHGYIHMAIHMVYPSPRSYQVFL